MRRIAWTVLLAEAVAVIVMSTPANAGGAEHYGHLRFNPDATLDVSQVEDRTHTP